MKKLTVISVIVLVLAAAVIPLSFLFDLSMKEVKLADGEYTVRKSFDDEETSQGNFFDLKTAKNIADDTKVYGYRVFDKYGDPVYFPYGSELVSDLMREGKWVADYVRENGFTYGDAPVNPAMNCDAKLVSCDRLVGWVLYRVGQNNPKYASYTDQIESHGIFVYGQYGSERDFTTWCENHNFKKIENMLDLQAGDIVFVIPKHTAAGTLYPGHVFMCAGPTESGTFYRYDGGSNQRIKSVQPFNEPINEFMYAYRPE